METNGQIQTTVKTISFLAGQQAAWFPEPVWTQRTKEKTLALAKNRS
jgi:hypothetical protein